MTTDEKPKNWLGRNWKWLVPAGCLVIVGACVVFILAILGLVFGAIRSSEVYQKSIDGLSADPRIVEALGTPVKPGFFVGGSINVNGPSGSADISIPLSGPKGKGTLYVKANKDLGFWLFTSMILEVNETGERIELITPP
jgi:hypothetical protein